MKSQALQELVNNIFSDNQTRLQFISNPVSVISHFGLTGPEKRAVLELQADPGLINAGPAEMEMAVRPNIGWLSPAP